MMKSVQPEDLIRFGMIPEFIGRLPVVSVLDPLTQPELERILVETKNALVKQYSKLFAMEGVSLRFSRDAIAAIAAKALELKTGARALRSIMENIMLDLMFELPDQNEVTEVHINAAVINGKKEPVVRRYRDNALEDEPAPTAVPPSPREDPASDAA
jgi:ATP-dependent Clp protease ATP-binding subunit ClpX